MSRTNSNYYTLTKLSVLFLSLLYLIWMMLSNELPFDTGDGLQHYAISKKAFDDPTLFLNHWGKPLFILFTASFAQFGFLAFTCFNLVVFTLTILFANRIYDQLHIRGILPVVTPLFLLSIPDYNGGIIGGLTEPFFGLLLVMMLWAALKEKWFLFALIASFTPFARSEGMLVLASAPLLLIAFKQWKTLPVLLVGFAVYAVAGQLLIGQPLWYFENDPYPEISPYGTGPWYDYIVHYESYIGKIAPMLLPFMLIGFFVWRQSEPKKAVLITLYFMGIFVGIVAVHSYLWAYGLKGSGGLTRIATQGMPSALIVGLACLGFVLRELHKVTNAIILLVLSFFLVKRINQQVFPVKASPFQKVILESAKYTKAKENAVGKVYYFDPLIAYYNGITSMEKHPKYIFSFLHLETDVTARFKTGDIIIRETHFGPIEQGLPLNGLAKYPWIKPVKYFYVDGNDLLVTGEPQMVAIYQIFPKSDSLKQTVFVSQKKSGLKPQYIHGNDEYTTVKQGFDVPSLHGFRQRLKVNYSFKKKPAADVFLIFSDSKETTVFANLTEVNGSVDLYFASGNKKGVLFVYNPSKSMIALTLTPDSWEEYTDIGVQNFSK